MTVYLPRELQMQKKRLILIFRKAKEEGKKTAWKIINGDYQLYLFVSDSTKVHNTKNKNTQTNLSGTTQSINMRANLSKMYF